MPEAVAHVRINTGVLALFEKRVLLWIAPRLPGWVGSDHLTALAFIGMAVAAVSFVVSRVWPPSLTLVVIALAVNWFGDSLDGTVARVRRQERPRYGYYVDHVLDIVGITLLVAGMAASHFMTAIVGLSFLVCYLLVSAEVFLATAVSGRFHMSFLRIGPTELRILLSIGTMMLYVKPTIGVFGMGEFLLFDVCFGVAAVGLLAVLAVSAARTAADLYRAEPLPPRTVRL